jgi:hypothetical protein
MRIDRSEQALVEGQTLYWPELAVDQEHGGLLTTRRATSCAAIESSSYLLGELLGAVNGVAHDQRSRTLLVNA